MNAAQPRTAPVSERAMIGRINRALAKDRRVVKASREGSSLYNNMGRFYMLDWSTNTVVDWKLDLTAVAKKLGCIAEWEHLE